MGGPWEEYQQATPVEPGPWAEYAPQIQMKAAHGTVIPTKESGFLDSVADRWGNRTGKVSAMVDRNTAGDFVSDIQNLPQMAALTAGQVAGGALDVGAEGVKSAYRGIVPENLREAISTTGGMLADTGPGRLAGKALQFGGNAYDAFSKTYPDSAMALEGGLNVVGLTGVSAGAKKMVPKPTQGMLSRQYSSTVKHGIEKAIRPGVEGKRTFGQAKNYFDRAEDAVSSIVDNAPNLKFTDDIGDVVSGKLPKNLRQFSESIDQTKKGLFDKYNAMAQDAGDAGAAVKLTPIADDISAITKSRPLMDNAPDVVDYAAKRAEALAGRGVYTAQEAQEAVTILNKSLDSFYKNPTYDTFGKAYIDSQIAQHLRKGLDDVIETTTGAGYQGLKRQYGSLKAIERDVNRRMIVSGRQNAKGLVDGFTDVLSGGQMVQGLLTANPATIGNAVAMKGLAKWVKRLNDPDLAVDSMFKKAARIKGRITPQPASTMMPPQVNPQPVQYQNLDIPAYKRAGVAPDMTYKYPPMQTPTTRALPAPQGFTLYTPEESASLLAQMQAEKAIPQRLGSKNIPGGGLLGGGITAEERRRINALQRGLSRKNR